MLLIDSVYKFFIQRLLRTSLSFKHFVRGILINGVPLCSPLQLFALSKRRRTALCRAHPEDTSSCISTETHAHTYTHLSTHVTASTQDVGTHGMRTGIFTLALPRTGASRFHQVDRLVTTLANVGNGFRRRRRTMLCEERHFWTYRRGAVR